MARADLTLDASDEDIDRELALDGERLRVALRGLNRSRKNYAELVGMHSYSAAPQDEKVVVLWELAVATWLFDQPSLARRTARKYLKSRPNADDEELLSAVRQRLRRKLDRGSFGSG